MDSLSSSCTRETSSGRAELETSRVRDPSTSGSSSQEFRVLVARSADTYHYTIPSFCAITMALQHVTIELEDRDVIDAFVRVGDRVLSSTINRPLPSYITIVSACIVPVSHCVRSSELQIVYIPIDGGWGWLSYCRSVNSQRKLT